MTPEKQRIAIAEFRGAVWKRQSCSPWYPDDEGRNVYFRRLYILEPGDIRGPATLPDAHGDEMVADDHSHLPDYFNDLNEIVKVASAWIDGDLQRLRRYSDNLKSVIQDWRYIASAVDARYLTAVATPQEHSEALLRTIGKWEE